MLSPLYHFVEWGYFYIRLILPACPQGFNGMDTNGNRYAHTESSIRPLHQQFHILRDKTETKPRKREIASRQSPTKGLVIQHPTPAN